MKKSFTLLLLSLLFLYSPATGQSRIVQPGKVLNGVKFTTSPSRLLPRQESDTLLAEAFTLECGNSVAAWPSPEWGFVGGTNEFGDKEKAQRLTFSTSNNLAVQEIWGFFAAASPVNDGDLRAKVYTQGLFAGPGSPVGVSNTLKTSQVQLNDEFLVPTIFSFPSPVRVTGEAFYASIDFSDLYAAQDTAGLWMFDEDCGNGDDAWELWEDGDTWLPISSDITWNFNSNFAIASVVEFGTPTVQDTLIPTAFQEECGNSVGGWTIEDWGFIGGTNSYLDLEKAQRLSFDAGDGVLVREVWGFFASASVVGDGQLKAKIYNVNESDGGPASLLGASTALKASAVVLNDDFVLPTIFTFADPVLVEGSELFASIDFSALYATQDTVGLFMSEEDCGDGADAWELWEGGSLWVPLSSESSWNFNSNFLIYAIVELQNISDVDAPFVTQRGLTLKPAFPNPANEQVTLPFELAQSGRTIIELYAADGRLLQRFDKGILPGGTHQEVLSTGNLPAGTYVYGVVTENSRLMSRFVIID